MLELKLSLEGIKSKKRQVGRKDLISFEFSTF